MRRSGVVVWAAAVVVLAGCTGGATPEEGASASATAVDDGAAADVVPSLAGLDVDGLGPGEVAALEDGAGPEPVTSTLYELVEAGVEDGRWSRAEGVAAALRFAAGTAPDDALAAAVGDELELTGLLRVAAELADDGSVPEDVRAELAAARAPFAPSQDTLDAISEPAPDSVAAPRTTSGLVAATTGVVPAGAVDGGDGGAGAFDPSGGAGFSVACTDAGAAGFEGDGLASGDPCYLFVERTVAGNRLRVYFPYTWGDDASDERRELALGLLDAMDVSTQAFSRYGEVGDANLVISLLDRSTEAAGWQYEVRGEETCQTVISPTGIGAGATSWQQTVAHELFHCVQDRNFTTEPYDSHRWWLEGSAEFFSNVAYPSNDDEHGSAEGFDRSSANTSIFDLSYENTLFFQHLANDRGIQGLWDLLRRVTPGGPGAAASALAGESGMARTWHDFVVFVSAQVINDTAGPPIPLGGRHAAGVETFDRERTAELDVEPWVAARFALRYETGRTFEQEVTMDGDGLHSAVLRRDIADPSAYGEPPDEVFSTCEDQEVMAVVVTSIEESVTLEVEVSDVEQAVCDGCVVGEWELDVESFETAVFPRIEQEGADLSGASLSGSGSVTFRADGTFSNQRDLTITFEDARGSVSSPFATIGGGGTYEADGETLRVQDGTQGPTQAPYECSLFELVVTEPETGEFRYARVFDTIEPQERTPPGPESVPEYQPSG